MAEQKNDSPARVRPGTDRFGELQGIFTAAKPRFQAILPKHLDADQIIRTALTLVSRTPTLLECTPQSLLLSTLQASALGLNLNPSLGLAYLVPMRNKERIAEATFIPGWRGLVALAIQSGEVLAVRARVVREGDYFEWELGLDERLVHRPKITNDPGPMVAVYSIAVMANGQRVFEVMSTGEVEFIRSKSKQPNSLAWADNFSEMARKTVTRRAAKYWPLSPERANRFLVAMEAQAKSEAGEIDYGEAVEVEQVAPPQLERSRTSSLAEQLASKAADPASVAKAEPDPFARQPGDD